MRLAVSDAGSHVISSTDTDSHMTSSKNTAYYKLQLHSVNKKPYLFTASRDNILRVCG